MSPTSRRRCDPDQGNRSAASEHDHGSTTVSDVEALAALRVLRAYFGAASTPDIFTQHRLPPDATSADAFLRRHRAQIDARAPGWTKSGKTRAVTADAWRADIEAETSREAAARPRRLKVVETAPVDAVAEVAAALGVRLRAT